MIFLLAATLSNVAFAANDPLYPPSAPVPTATPTNAAGVVPQSTPVAPGTLGPAPTTATAPAVTPQQPTAAPGNSTAPAPAAAPAATAQPTAPAQSQPATGTVPVQKVEKKGDGFTQQGEEIGFDPKVKRDPYGNIIDESGRPKTEAEKLRGDMKSTLRSDVKKAAPTAPTTAAMPKVPSGAKQVGGPATAAPKSSGK